MSFIVDAAVMSHCGKVRDTNEDNFVFNRKHLPEDNLGMSKPYGKIFDANEEVVMGIFDGMGGEQYGQTASFAAAELVSEKAINSIDETVLEKLCFEMNAAVVEAGKSKRVHRCGTTCAMIAFANQSAYFCNVGDSKIIHIRNHCAEQISKDHLSASIINGTVIKRKPTLTQYLGVDPEDFIIEPFYGRKELSDGDVFIVCSDGLSDSVSLDDISDTSLNNNDSKELAENLVNMALERDGKDNISVIVSRIKEVNDEQ